jgi:hypothetical protein
MGQCALGLSQQKKVMMMMMMMMIIRPFGHWGV